MSMVKLFCFHIQSRTHPKISHLSFLMFIRYLFLSSSVSRSYTITILVQIRASRNVRYVKQLLLLDQMLEQKIVVQKTALYPPSILSDYFSREIQLAALGARAHENSTYNPQATSKHDRYVVI